ncbi:hypothetical protein Y032_0044g1040 [Ancylostoma ceylanicum]|uniref:C2H2-type domain-containing protein n=1 Tax=Ancylostoma ceylanicum TaxID=53326 RepID=A0A016UDI2_9BILA|nr:hypothetical protein Y032_0044g1040 [Ancylostoma ceylanicum]
MFLPYSLQDYLLQDYPQVGHKYAIVKLYKGLDEATFERLLKGLGLKVVYTNDPSAPTESEISPPKGSIIDLEKETRQPFEAPMSLYLQMDPILYDYAALLQFIEANINVDLNKSSMETTGPKVTVQCKVGRPILLKPDDVETKTLTCMICHEEVLRDRSALKSHVQSHSGKRYGCSRCKYHTDRKFDFTRHIRRRHEGEPDPSEGHSRPHWMTMLRSCFPTYGDFAKLRRIRRQRIPPTGSAQLQASSAASDEQNDTKQSTGTSCSPVIC